MKTFVLLLIGCLMFSVAMALECEEGEVMLCHKPLKQNTTLCVLEVEVQEHLEHGDFLGSCEEGPNIIPTVPILISPANQEVLDSIEVNFDWEDSEDMNGDNISYVFIVDECVEDSIIYETNVLDSNYITQLEDAKVYCWKVMSFDSKEYSDWSEQRIFVINSKVSSDVPQETTGGGGSISKTEQINKQFSEVYLFEVKSSTSYFWLILVGLTLVGLGYAIYKRK